MAGHGGNWLFSFKITTVSIDGRMSIMESCPPRRVRGLFLSLYLVRCDHTLANLARQKGRVAKEEKGEMRASVQK